MQANSYIGKLEIIEDHREKKIVIELIGRINKYVAINPKYDLALEDYEKWTSNILQSRQIGHLVISTTKEFSLMMKLGTGAFVARSLVSSIDFMSLLIASDFFIFGNYEIQDTITFYFRTQKHG